jgi:hypothetical protein
MRRFNPGRDSLNFVSKLMNTGRRIYWKDGKKSLNRVPAEAAAKPYQVPGQGRPCSKAGE